jgi:hypothetical protein
MGSTEPHYTPSKIFQAVHSGRPVFALLHEMSSAVGMLCDSGAGTVVTLNERQLPEPAQLAQVLRQFVEQSSRTISIPAAFERYSARNSARELASALDQALARPLAD